MDSLDSYSMVSPGEKVQELSILETGIEGLSSLLEDGEFWLKEVKKVERNAELEEIDVSKQSWWPTADFETIEKSLGDMLIDLDVEGEASLESDITKMSSDHDKRFRESQLQIAGIHGSRWIGKLLIGFNHFRDDAICNVKKKRKMLIADLGYDVVVAKLNKKKDMLFKMKDDLRKKMRLLAEKKYEETLTPEQVRAKYEQQYIAKQVKDLILHIEQQKHEINETISERQRIDDDVRNTKTELAQLVHELKKKVEKQSRQDRKKKAVGFDKEGNIVFDGDPLAHDILYNDRSEVEKQYHEQQQEIERLITSTSETATKIVGVEKRTIITRDEIEKLLHSAENKALQRLKLACSNIEERLKSNKEKMHFVMRRLNGDFEVHDFECAGTKSQIAELMRRREVREGKMLEDKQKMLDAMFNPAPKEKKEVKISRAVRYMNEVELNSAVQISSFLTKASKPARTELISAEHRQMQSTLFATKPSLNEAMGTIKGTITPSNNEQRIDQKHADSLLSFMSAKSKDDEQGDLLEDCGLQMCAEQLVVLENLLKDGSRKHIEAAKVQAIGPDGISLRTSLMEIIMSIQEEYTTNRKMEKKKKKVNKGLDGIKDKRDGVRTKFLSIINEWGGMPKTIYARGKETEFLSRRIVDLKKEIGIVRDAIDEKNKELVQLRNQSKKKVRNVISFLSSKKSSFKKQTGRTILEEGAEGAQNEDVSAQTPLPEAKKTSDVIAESQIMTDDVKTDPKGKKTSSGDGSRRVDRGIVDTTVPLVSSVDGETSDVSLSGVDASFIDTGSLPDDNQKPIGVPAMTVDVAQKRRTAGSGRPARTNDNKKGAISVIVPMDDDIIDDREDTNSLPTVPTDALDKRKQDGECTAVDRIYDSVIERLQTHRDFDLAMPPVLTKGFSAASTLTASSGGLTENNFNQVLDGRSPSGMNLGLESEYDTSDAHVYVAGEEWTDDMSDTYSQDASVAREGNRDLLPVAVIDLMIDDESSHYEDSLEPSSGEDKSVYNKRIPYHLYLSQELKNLHFGGHRLKEEMDELSDQLPDMSYILRGKNDTHYSVPSLPSAFRSQIKVKEHQRRERQNLIRKAEYLMERVDASRKQMREEKRMKRIIALEEKARRAKQREKDEESAGVMQDLDCGETTDSEDAGSLDAVVDDNDYDDMYDDVYDDEHSPRQQMKAPDVKDLLSLQTKEDQKQQQWKYRVMKVNNPNYAVFELNGIY